MDYRSCRKRCNDFWMFPGLIIILLAFISGCGDGGSSESSGSSSGLTYSGSTTQAEITEQNASQLSANVMTVGSNSSAFDTIDLSENQAEKNDSGPFIFPAMMTIIKDAACRIDLSQPMSHDLSAALQTQSGTFNGDCAIGSNGSASYSIQVNDETGVFSGSFEFSDFCVDITVIDGSSSFSGTVNVQTEEMQSFTLVFDDLTVSSGEFSFTFDGSIEMNLNSSEAGTTMNILVRNDQSDDVYRVVDYSISVTDYGSYKAIEISGTFYDPDNGYVTVSTPEPLLYENSATYPYSGRIVLTGVEGSTARLTAVSATTCRLQVDADGDGTYEYDSGVILWRGLRTN